MPRTELTWFNVGVGAAENGTDAGVIHLFPNHISALNRGDVIGAVE